MTLADEAIRFGGIPSATQKIKASIIWHDIHGQTMAWVVAWHKAPPYLGV